MCKREGDETWMSKVMEGSECQQEDFEPSAEIDWEPVQLLEDSDVYMGFWR